MLTLSAPAKSPSLFVINRWDDPGAHFSRVKIPTACLIWPIWVGPIARSHIRQFILRGGGGILGWALSVCVLQLFFLNVKSNERTLLHIALERIRGMSIVDNNVVSISWLAHNCPKYKTKAHVSPTAVDKMKLQIGSLPKSHVGSGLREVEAELENSEMKNKNPHSLS